MERASAGGVNNFVAFATGVRGALLHNVHQGGHKLWVFADSVCALIAQAQFGGSLGGFRI